MLQKKQHHIHDRFGKCRTEWSQLELNVLLMTDCKSVTEFLYHNIASYSKGQTIVMAIIVTLTFSYHLYENDLIGIGSIYY